MPPPNDSFANAQVILGVSGSVQGDNTGATTQANDPLCNHWGNGGGKNVWYRWVAPGYGELTVETSPPSSGSPIDDTLLGVFRGASYAALEPLNTDDDSGTGNYSKVVEDVERGDVIYIEVDGYSGNDCGASGPDPVAEGAFTLTWSLAPSPPPNDNNGAAFGDDDFQLPCRPGTVTVHDSNVGATKQVGEPNFDGTVGGHSVWWWWSSPGNGTVTISVNPDYVYGAPLTNPLLLVYDCDDFCDFDHSVAEGHGSVTFTAKQGIDYVIGIDGVAGQQGDFALTLVRPTPPANDLQALAEELPGDSGSTTGTTNWACTEDDPDVSSFNDVWYKWTPSVSGWAKLTQTLIDGLDSFSRRVSVYTGGPGTWVPITTRSPTGASGGPDVQAGSVWDLYFPIVAGTTYYVVVSGRQYNGVTQDRFALDWFAPMDLSDIEPADLVVGPAVSSHTETVPEPTPAGTWFRFELEHDSGALPTHDGTLPGYMGLLEFKDDTGAVVAQVRLKDDYLEARSGNNDADSGNPWQGLGKPTTLGPGLSKTRLEVYFRKPPGGALRARFRINGVPVGTLVGNLSHKYIKTLRRGCLWNGGGDNVAVQIKNVGIRVDPDLGPWYSTDPDDLGVIFLWGGEGGELGGSNGGTSWLGSSGSPNAPTVIAAPGAGPSPAGRYGYALDCSTTTQIARYGLDGGDEFTPRAARSFYFHLTSYPNVEQTIFTFVDAFNGAFVGQLRVTPTGTLRVRWANGYDSFALRHVSLNRWHHVEAHLDALTPQFPMLVRLNGVAFGPFYPRQNGFRNFTDPFVPTAAAYGKPIAESTAFGIAVKDIVAYREDAFPLGGQTIRKRVPDGVGTHDANVDEWVAGSNQQTPVTDGDARFDYSGYAVDSYDPPDWLHNVHFADTSSPDGNPLQKMQVKLASVSPPAEMVGEKVLSYRSKATPITSGAYVAVPPPRVDAPHRYLVEAWVYKEPGGEGQFDSEAFPVFLQSWPWTAAKPASYGGWFRFAVDKFQIGLGFFAADSFGFNHSSDTVPFLYQIGPITIWEDFVYEPRATGFWQSDDNGATYTSIQNSDAISHNKIQEWPPAAGGKVIGVGPATPGWDTPASPAGNADKHLEYTLQDDGSVGGPIMGARFYVRGRGYTWRNRSTDPNDGSISYPSRGAVESSGAPVLYAQDVSGGARRWLPALNVSRGGQAAGVLGHDSYVLPVAPDDDAWTAAAWNAFRIRLGFPTSLPNPNGVIAEPVVEAFAVELLVPEPELPPEGGGPLLGFSFRAERSAGAAAAVDDQSADVHLAGIEFRT